MTSCSRSVVMIPGLDYLLTFYVFPSLLSLARKVFSHLRTSLALTCANAWACLPPQTRPVDVLGAWPALWTVVRVGQTALRGCGWRNRWEQGPVAAVCSLSSAVVLGEIAMNETAACCVRKLGLRICICLTHDRILKVDDLVKNAL